MSWRVAAVDRWWQGWWRELEALRTQRDSPFGRARRPWNRLVTPAANPRDVANMAMMTITSKQLPTMATMVTGDMPSEGGLPPVGAFVV
jgi:hypothetical protein